MMKMKLEQLSQDSQDTIRHIAQERGTTPEKMLRRYDAILSGRKVSRHLASMDD